MFACELVHDVCWYDVSDYNPCSSDNYKMFTVEKKDSLIITRRALAGYYNYSRKICIYMLSLFLKYKEREERHPRFWILLSLSKDEIWKCKKNIKLYLGFWFISLGKGEREFLAQQGRNLAQKNVISHF